MGDVEYGITHSSGYKSPEIAEFYNTHGVLTHKVVDDLMLFQVGIDYVKKHEKMIEVL